MSYKRKDGVVIHDNKEDFEKMRIAGRVAAACLDFITPYVQVGVTTGELDDLCRKFMEDHGAIPACLGYRGYPKSTCISFSLTLISTRLKTVLCTKYSFGFSFFENRFVHSIVSTKDNSNSKKFAFVILTGDVLVRFSSLASIYFSSFSLVFDLNIL